jgi:hypothetical protein
MKRNLLTLLVTLSVSVPAFASSTVFDFANLEYTSGHNTGFTPTNGQSCTGGDQCSSNVGGNLTYVANGITVGATGSYYGRQATAMQDHDNGFNNLLYGSTAVGAGLGVYHLTNDSSDDNITAGEVLKLSFDQLVTLDEFGLRADGHNTTGWNNGDTFRYSLDGINWLIGLLPDNSLVGNTHAGRFLPGSPLTGKDFYFSYGGNHANQFYLSSVSVSAVPLPPSFALMLPALGLLGVMTRKRKLAA